MSIRIGGGPAVRVRDNGHDRGLRAMRERVATVGGTLHTGLAAGSGFLVEARLPVWAEVAG